MKANPGFSAFAKSGFQIRFENGWTVSVQFSAAHYCGNRDTSNVAALVKAMEPEMLEFGSELSCASAELAAFKGDKWYTFKDGDNVKGWATPADLLAFLVEIAGKSD